MGSQNIQHIFEGEIDPVSNNYVLKKVKNLETQSVISPEQIQTIYKHLSKVLNSSEDYVITVNDQMPIRLSHDDIKQLLIELEEIKNGLH
ncbi:hypothetical protein J2S00_000015 [Caldalkalibacillus uzonensis]|uniref:Uncharacterized protein n=1 Tax=Caldalkalibacillus uzonensis TaxID=353224 RepID=A0ABU0CP23_9BACI|nr:hypothetical protein [Caldalkalibacillus uzonensis]MDQ0337245.1 hypothetical protein [Caldalkalibacillus uzonensis]